MMYLLSICMYWNNPIITVVADQGEDVFLQSQHDRAHTVFYDPAVPLADIKRYQTLGELCQWANDNLHMIKTQCLDAGEADRAGCVINVNRFVQSLSVRGNIKPMLLFWSGQRPYDNATGSTRIMALDALGSTHTVSAFVATGSQHAQAFGHLHEITSLVDLARHAGGHARSQVSLRLTDTQAPWGIDWYEIDLDDPDARMPQLDRLIQRLADYLQQQPESFRFDSEWFLYPRNWGDLR